MLYIVGTPIGNLGDMTQRGLETLRSVSLIIAESIPDTKRLLAAYDIHPEKIIKYNDRNKEKSIPELLSLLKEYDAAFVTSAGMPGVSDPGADLVAAAREAGLQIQPIPGVSALSTAIAMSGFFAKRSIFLGFLPRKKSRIHSLVKPLLDPDALIVFFESPFRIAKSLEVLAELDPDMHVFVGREMTKKFEAYSSGTIHDILGQIESDTIQKRGEFTVVIQV